MHEVEIERRAAKVAKLVAAMKGRITAQDALLYMTGDDWQRIADGLQIRRPSLVTRREVLKEIALWEAEHPNATKRVK